LPMGFADIEFGVWVRLLFSGLVCAVFAVVVGSVLMRVSGLSAGIATLALLLIIRVVITESESWTRGHHTLIGVPNSMSMLDALWISLFVSSLAVCFQSSRIGRFLRATRDDQLAA